MMAKKKYHDPYVELLGVFNRYGIKYVVVGMSGINYYASETRETFSTQDYDIFIKPTIENVKKAMAIFKKLGYSLIANNQNAEHCSIKEITRHRSTILANDPYGITFELILAVSGYAFGEMQGDATIFKVGNIPIKVAKLKKLLMSKKLAAREKDKIFLKRFEALLREKFKENSLDESPDP